MAIFDDARNPTDPRVDELSHYGRKGMKWGQRIFSRRGSKEPKPPKMPAWARRLKKIDERRGLTPKELAGGIARMTLDRKIIDLKRENKTQISLGKKFQNRMMISGPTVAGILGGPIAGGIAQATVNRKILDSSRNAIRDQWGPEMEAIIFKGR